MTPAELRAALAQIGWSASELARQLPGCHRNTPVWWTTGQRTVPEPVARWVRALAKSHAAHPAPDGWRRTG